MKRFGPKTALSAFVVLLASVLVSCAPTIRVQRLKPAPYAKAAMLTNITIVPFTGPDAQRLTRSVEQILGAITIDNRSFFSVAVEGESVGYAQRRRAGLPGTIGGYGTLTGRVTESRCAVERYTQERRACIESVGSGEKGECVRWRHYKVDCFRQTGKFGFNLKLKETRSQKVLYRQYSSGKESSSACNSAPGGRGGLRGNGLYRGLNPLFDIGADYGFLRCEYWSKKRLITTAMKKAIDKSAEKFRRDIAPRYVTESIRLMDSAEGIESKEARERLKKGIEHARNLWLLKAREEWEQAYRLAPLSTSVTYNLGVSAEFYGRFDKAIALYKRAAELSKGRNPLIPESIKRVERIVEANRLLNSQMKAR